MTMQTSSFLRLMTRRTRSGQSILLVAVSMIALIAFVGIATDVALLFVRYNALRRAVDSAAIAVAGQVRTGVDFAKLNNVARQFVQLQGGVEADTVKVETCETDIADYVTDYKAAFPSWTYPNPDPIDTAEGRASFDPLNHVIRGVGDLYLAEPNRPRSELCKFDPQKLVRVSAQVQSETAFLVIIGWREVTLVASTISQTASLDVALLIDNSSSMSADTVTAQTDTSTYPCTVPGSLGGDYATAASRINPSGNCATTYNGRLASAAGGLFQTNYFQLLSFKPFTDDPALGGLGLRPALPIVLPAGVATPDTGLYPGTAGFLPGGRVGDPSYVPAIDAGTFINNPVTSQPQIFLNANYNNRPLAIDSGSGLDAKTVRAECIYNIDYLNRGWDNGLITGMSATKAANYGWGGCCNDPTVQANPASSKAVPGYVPGVPTEGQAQLQTKLAFDSQVDPDFYITDDGTGTEARINTGVIARSMDVVTYNHGDNNIRNNGDGNFSDLVCQPFKQVRDAARRFIRRLDFVRGDRLAIITFSENAEIVCPTYERPFRDAAFNVTDQCATSDPFIYDKDLAVRTLNFKVGVTHNWNKTAGYQELCRMGVSRYSPSAGGTSRRGLTYWAVSQCPNTNTGGAIYLARSVLKGNYVRREAVWVLVMLSDGYPNRTPAIGTFDVLGRRDDQAPRNWLEVPETGQPAAFSADELYEYCSYRKKVINPDGTTSFVIINDNDPPPSNFPYDASRAASTVNVPCDTTDPINRTHLENFFGPADGSSNVAETIDHCNKYGSRPELCPKWYPGFDGDVNKALQNQQNRSFSFGFCPWSSFCLPSYTDNSNGLGLPDAVVMKLECYGPGATTTTGSAYSGNVVSGTVDLEQQAAWQVSGTAPFLPLCTDNDPDSRHFCSNAQGWVNAYADDDNNNGEPDAGDVTPSNCSKYYDADDYARDQADWAGLLQYTDRTPGDFIAMFGIFFGKKDETGRERPVGENILGVKFMRYMSDAGDNGRIDNNLQEWYRRFRNQPDPRGLGVTQGVIVAPGAQPHPFDLYRNGASIAALPTSAGWMDPDQNDCAQWDFNEYKPVGGLRSTFPSADVNSEYEQIARKDCDQFWFANDISKVNRAFTEIAGRLFTRLSR